MKNLTVNMPLAVPHQKPPSKYASHPYPILISEDAYRSTIKTLDITLKRMLHKVDLSEALQPTLKTLDITLRSVLLNKSIDNGGALAPTLKTLDITLYRAPPMKHESTIASGLQPTLKTLNITLRRLLIQHSVSEESAVQPTLKTLDITLKTGV